MSSKHSILGAIARVRGGVKTAIAAVALGAALLFPSTAGAWNAAGHCTVDEIAWRNLRPDVREKLEAIILRHPRVRPDLLRGKPTEIAEGRYAFIRAGTWPDIVRDKGNPMNAAYNKTIWHYTTVPFCPEGDDTKYVVEIAKDIKPGEPYDSMSAWSYNLARLSDASLPLSERAVALTWILHLGGDIHQPLHNVSVFSPRFPEGDKGGNEWIFMEGPTIRNLHAIWDGLLGSDTDLDVIERRADQIQSEYPQDSLAQEVKQHDQREWSRLARQLAIRYAYLNGELKGPSRVELAHDDLLPIPQLSYKYKKAAIPVGERQAALAGYRLASVLNSIPLDIPATPVPDPLADMAQANASIDPTTRPFTEGPFPPMTRERIKASTRPSADEKPTTRPVETK